MIRPGSSLLCVEKTASPSYGAICAVKEERKTSKTPAWVSFVSSNTSPETLPLQHPGVVLRRGLTDLLKGPSREQEGGAECINNATEKDIAPIVPSVSMPPDITSSEGDVSLLGAIVALLGKNIHCHNQPTLTISLQV